MDSWKGELQEHTHTHLTDTANRTPVLTISGRWGKLDMVGCFSTTRALQRHQSNVHIRLQKSTTNVSFDPAAHFLSSWMHKDAAAFSVSSRGAENSEASAQLYFLFCCCSFWSCSRSSRSTSKTEVNLHVQHHTVNMLERSQNVYLYLQIVTFMTTLVHTSAEDDGERC